MKEYVLVPPAAASVAQLSTWRQTTSRVALIHTTVLHAVSTAMDLTLRTPRNALSDPAAMD